MRHAVPGSDRYNPDKKYEARQAVPYTGDRLTYAVEHINAVTVLAVMNIHHMAGLLSVQMSGLR